MKTVSMDSSHRLSTEDLCLNNSNDSQSPRAHSDKWDSYSQTLLEKGVVRNFGVYSRDKLRAWTTTPDFYVSAEELKSIISGFKDSIHIRRDGINVQGELFTLTRMSWNHVMMIARSSVSGSGLVVYLCRTCLLIATHDEGPQTSLCYNAVEKLGDFLVYQGF